MTLLNETDLQSFVLLRLGDRRFAVTATQIAELVAPSRVFRFPHHTGEVEGVILRRGRIVSRMKATMARLGVRGFNVKLRKALEKLAGLRTPEGVALQQVR